MADLTHKDGTDSTPKTTFLQDYRAPDYLIEQVELTFNLSAERTRVENKLQVQRAADADKTAPLVLDGQLLKLISLAINDKPLLSDTYTVNDEQLIIHVLPDRFSLSVITEIEPAKNTALEGLYASISMLCTQ